VKRRTLIHEFITTLANGDIKTAVEQLTILTDTADDYALPGEFLRLNCEALQKNNWDVLSQAFVNEEFIGPEGEFLIVAPYTARRQARKETLLTAIYGKVLPYEVLPDLSKVVDEIQGPLKEPIGRIMSFRRFASCGMVGTEGGEAFLVPDDWGFKDSHRAPALNDMTEQQTRYMTAKRCIEIIFDMKSANLLLESRKNGFDWMMLRHREYGFHDAGHSTGLGLKTKLGNDLLPTPWYRGVEEWRADGIEFELLRQTLSECETGRTIAANLSLRLGLDAHREGGVERDTDVVAAQLALDALLESGALEISADRKLGFTNPTYEGLVEASHEHRSRAIQLTRDELALQYQQGIWGLYGSIKISKASRVLLQGLVIDPCKGVFQNLH